MGVEFPQCAKYPVTVGGSFPTVFHCYAEVGLGSIVSYRDMRQDILTDFWILLYRDIAQVLSFPVKKASLQ